MGGGRSFSGLQLYRYSNRPPASSWTRATLGQAEAGQAKGGCRRSVTLGEKFTAPRRGQIEAPTAAEWGFWLRSEKHLAVGPERLAWGSVCRAHGLLTKLLAAYSVVRFVGFLSQCLLDLRLVSSSLCIENVNMTMSHIGTLVKFSLADAPLLFLFHVKVCIVVHAY
ncbi:hypothetical protein EYF80_057649 [Liparis tanakae]|uniref:Uncharacterized protein n=1 Tax=Liparis tanakae TaxID=230148 RepID=A0A4Z2EVB8_9TELE|nr:hypothetical protein EYF80_057649 [Liparis tanakae]